MDVNSLQLRGVALPGLAGEHQRARATASLVRELGDNYGHYHDFLAAEIARLGDRPQPSLYERDPERYLRICDGIQQLLRAEMTLRMCRELRQSSGAAQATAAQVPLVDEDHRLLSVEDARPSKSQPPSRQARSWRPPQMPRWPHERRR